MHAPRIFCWSIFGLLLPVAVQAQAERHELGRRLRAFEEAFEVQTDDAARKRAMPVMNRAVQGFFSGKIAVVAECLDQARHTLRSPTPVSTEVQWADSLWLKMERRLVDASAADVGFTLESFYPVKSTLPAGIRCRVTLTPWPFANLSEMKPAGTPWIAQIKAVPFAARLPLAGLPTGDYQLRYEILHNDRVVSQGKSLLSRVENLEGRLKTMAERAEQIKDAKSVETATFRHLYQLLTTLNTGRTQETDYPAARLFVEAEAAWQHHQAGQAYYAAVRPGEYWLALPQARSTTVVRAMIPKEAARGQPLPLVIALHGAGGSENLFFDGYGSGKIVPLCQARGWILVAPRSGLGRTNLPEMIDGLSKLYPIDKDRVFLVGHSMGAGQALSAVTANPERYAAVAALGGGGRIRPTKAMETVPFFIGIGTQDFAYSGARALRTSLNNGGVRQVLYKEYPDLEHMVIVQVALPEVMEFFATVKKQAP